jgi:hypothetical protein
MSRKNLDAFDEEFNETLRHFDIVGKQLAGKLQRVLDNNELLVAELREFRAEVRAEFRELQALIKFFLIRSWIEEFGRGRKTF